MKTLARKLLAMTLATVMMVSMGTIAFAAEFTDMPSKDAWSYEALQAAVDNGLLKGANGALNPKGLLQRAELATMVNRAFGAAQTADLSGYNDVPQSAWYYLEMAKAVKMKTFQGSGSVLNPEQAITREQAFAVLARALQLPAGDASILNQYSDGAQVSSSLKSELAAMVAAGYVKGNGGLLNPNGTITREEFAQVMHNVIKTYISATEPVTSLADSSVMVNVPGATLKGVTVKGDLIVGDGVGAGDFTMDAVTVQGRLVIRGGGANSIKLTNGSSVADVVINKPSEGGVRIVSDASSTVSSIVIAGGAGSVVIDGTVGTVSISGTAAVEIKGTVSKVDVQGEGVSITVDKGATVAQMTISGGDITVSGDGKITAATISGNNAQFNVADTKVTVAAGAEGTTVGGKAVEGGKDVVSEKPVTPPTEEKPSGGGGGGGGGGSTTSDYKDEIDALLNDNKEWILGALDSGITVDFASTSTGGTVTVNYDSSQIQTIGEAADLMKQFAYDNAVKVTNFVADTAKYVKSITVRGVTLSVNDTVGVDDVKAFVAGVFDSIYGAGNWNNDTLTSTLTGPETVTIVDKANNTYTYTVSRVAG